MSDAERQATERGYFDYEKGIVVGDNPFTEEDPLFWCWLDGWSQAGMAAIIAKQQGGTHDR